MRAESFLPSQHRRPDDAELTDMLGRVAPSVSVRFLSRAQTASVARAWSSGGGTQLPTCRIQCHQQLVIHPMLTIMQVLQSLVAICDAQPVVTILHVMRAR